MIWLEGTGLHGGKRGAIALSRAQGPTTLGRGDDRCALRSLEVSGADHASDARLPSGAVVRTVEHLLAAIAGMGAFQGLRVEVEGDEIPLFDGGACRVAQAIAGFVTPRPRIEPVVIAKAARFEDEGATLELSPLDRTEIEAVVDFRADRFGKPLCGSARWNGDPHVFMSDIAPSRTFGASHELTLLRARGLASHVPKGAVTALDVDDPEWAPRDPDEPIRHKLLDLIGDLAPLGAPLRGRLVARKPSHRTTRTLLERAISEGVITFPATETRLASTGGRARDPSPRVQGRSS